MLKFASTLLVAAVLILAAGCGQSAEAPQAEAPAPQVAVPDAEIEAIEVIEPEVAEAEPVEEASVEAAGSGGLAGTTWIISDIQLTFEDDENLLLTGGMINEVAPQGIRGEYTLGDGTIDVSMNIMGEEQTRRGTWDGERLVIDGAPAVRQD